MSNEKTECSVEMASNRKDRVSGSGLSTNCVVLLLLVAMVAGAGLRLVHMAEEMPWYDEIVSLRHMEASSDYMSFMRENRKEDPSMMPVYYTIEYFWWRAMGESWLSVRMLSFFLGMLLIPLAYGLARLLYSQRAGLFVAFYVALSLQHVYRAQEIRMYMLTILMATASMYCFVRMLQRDGYKWWAFHILLNLLLPLTNLYAALLLPAQGLFLLLFRFSRKKEWLVWGVSNVLAVVPAVLFALNIDYARLNRLYNFMPEPSLNDIAHLFISFVGARATHWNPKEFLPGQFSFEPVLFLCAATLIGFYAIRSVWWRQDKKEMTRGKSSLLNSEKLGLLLLWLILPAVLLYLNSALVRPSFRPRYVAHSMIPFQLLVAAGFSSIRSFKLRTGLVIILLALQGFQLTILADGPFRVNYQQAGDYLDTNKDPDDALIAFCLPAHEEIDYNTRYKKDSVERIGVWTDVAPRSGQLLEQHPVVWLAMYLQFDPGRIEKRLSDGNLSFSYQDFQGQPRLRVYKITKE